LVLLCLLVNVNLELRKTLGYWEPAFGWVNDSCRTHLSIEVLAFGCNASLCASCPGKFSRCAVLISGCVP
jgi:hypothetical protein